MITTHPFGSTGHLSTRTLFGAAALGSRSQADADRTMEFLLEKGVNHIDTAADYGDSEIRLGPWMERHRNHFFLATKTQGRTYDAAREGLHRSLERLRTDHVDLIQMHILVDEDEWQTAFGARGALEYLIEARDEGLTRFIGVTGHGLTVARMHERSLDRFAFDSVLLPWNYALSRNETYANEFAALVARCEQQGVAVQTIKAVARGPWGEKTHTRDTWYEPLERQADIDRAVWWLLGLPGLFLNTAGDVDILPMIIDAAERFTGDRPSDDDMKNLASERSLEPLFT